MTCEEFLACVDALALDALEPGEREACARHLREPGPHRGCAEALAEAREAAAALATASRQRTPAARVWNAIERAVTAEPRAAKDDRFDPDAT